jgi:hypothetical protein
MDPVTDFTVCVLMVYHLEETFVAGHMPTSIRFSTFPRTLPPPHFTVVIRDVFQANAEEIGTKSLKKGLTSDQVLSVVRPDLIELGFMVEAGKHLTDKIKRPVFFGENGAPGLQYEIDAYHESWKCGLEIEAGRAWMGNAIYRDLIQALVMVELETLVMCIPLGYRYKSSGKDAISKDYDNAVAVADAIYGHSRIVMPYRLVVIGY